MIALLCGMLSYRLLMQGVTDISILEAGSSTALLLERDGHTGVVLMGDDTAVLAAACELDRRNVRTVDFLMMPRLDDRCAFCPMILTGKVGVNCLVTGPSGEYSDTVDALNIGDWASFEDGGITFWNDCLAELENGWLRITIGQTRLLLCSCKENASGLKPDFRQTNLVVISGSPPLHVSAIRAQAGVLCCRQDLLADVIKTIPRGTYPLYNTSGGDVRILTRGRGDITIKGGNMFAGE